MTYEFKELYSGGGGIIEVDKLPTENIDENVFYLVGGKYYRWEKNGTWVFKDELSIPDEFYGNTYYFRYTVPNIPDEGDLEFTAIRFYDDGIKYIEYIDADGGVMTVHQDGVGWFSDAQAYKTIKIQEMPTDDEFLDWVYENANAEYDWHEYVSTPVDNSVGTWIFIDTITPPSKTFNVTFISDGYEYAAIEGGADTLYYSSWVGDYTEPVYSIDVGRWYNPKYQVIQITEAVTDESLIAWLKANATHLSGRELPIHEGIIPAEEVQCYDGKIYVMVPVGRSVVKSGITTTIPLGVFGSAEKWHVLKGKTFTSEDGYLSEGTMSVYDATILTAERNENCDTDDGIGFEVFVGGNTFVDDCVYFTVPKSALPSGGGSYEYSAIEIWDDEGYGPIDVTYKVEENGKLVNKTKILPNSGDIKMSAPRGTEIFVNKDLNFWAQSEQDAQINLEYRYADGGLYITVPDLDFCRITLRS